MTIKKSMFLLLALCCIAFAQEKPKVAVYATGGKSPSENKVLSNKMTNALVSSGKYLTIERSDAFLEQVANEQAKQRQGAIDDKQISRIGKQSGADYVCIAEMVEAFGGHQISARIVNVETVAVLVAGEAHGTLNSMQAFDDITNNVIASMFGTPKKDVSTTPAANAPTINAVANAPVARPSASAASNITGTLVMGKSLAEKLAWLERGADSDNTYIIEVNADESIEPYKLRFDGAKNITVVLRGDMTNRTIKLKSKGSMFTVTNDVTFILENNITLQGHSDNNSAVINNNGTFKMYDGATITGNNNNKYGVGGGVNAGGIFEMNGGTISGNAAWQGGGVIVYGKFTMRGGIITGNTARKSGGGVFINAFGGSITKTGGTITGYNSDQSNGNVVDDGSGAIARNGHAVWVGQSQRKETTAGTNVNLSSKDSKTGWDN